VSKIDRFSIRKPLFKPESFALRGARVNARGDAEIWMKMLEMLRTIRVSKEKLEELERMVNRLTAEMAEASRRGVLPNPGDAYEQLQALARLSSAIERIGREMEELERLERKIQALEKRIEMDQLIMDQIREQLRKKLQVVVREEKSDLKFNPENPPG
jgi:uncharacterized protein (DUF342 family)